MKKRLFLAALLAAAGMAACAAQEPAEDKTVRHAAVQLSDGTLLMGTLPVETSLPVQADELKADIALQWVSMITIDADHKKAAIEMQNGDRVSGVLLMKSLTLKTSFGDVALDWSWIKTVEISGPGEKVIEDAKTAFNDCITLFKHGDPKLLDAFADDCVVKISSKDTQQPAQIVPSDEFRKGMKEGFDNKAELGELAKDQFKDITYKKEGRSVRVTCVVGNPDGPDPETVPMSLLLGRDKDGKMKIHEIIVTLPDLD